jgi:UV DNA damage endonuclease
MTRRLGFPCKWMESADPKKSKDVLAEERTSNTSGTTVAWLDRQSRQVAEQRLWDVMDHNLKSVKKLLTLVSGLDPTLHQVRIGSDLLPMYTHAAWGYFWQTADVKRHYEREFALIGELARHEDIRLSFHPGQFCVLASQDGDIVNRSIEEFEYHVDMARAMGYGSAWHDHGFKINIHISGALGPAGMISALQRMSPEARNLITIENDEMRWGLDDCLGLEKHAALVLDIHHHLLHSHGEYIKPSDPRWKRVIDSWRGVRPVIHYSLSREDVLPTNCPNTLPDVADLLASKTVSKTHLRAHSNNTWNHACNDWALLFWPDADIMVESKWKNISTMNLLHHARTRNLAPS